MYAVEIRKMFALTRTGRDGRKCNHVVLLTTTGRVFSDTQIHKWTNVEAVKARYQKIADAYNAGSAAAMEVAYGKRTQSAA